MFVKRCSEEEEGEQNGEEVCMQVPTPTAVPVWHPLMAFHRHFFMSHFEVLYFNSWNHLGRSFSKCSSLRPSQTSGKS